MENDKSLKRLDDGRTSSLEYLKLFLSTIGRRDNCFNNRKPKIIAW